MKIKTAVTSVFLALGLAAPVALMAQVQGEKRASDKSDGTKPAEAAAAKLLRTDSPTPYVHRLTLYDHAGQAIDPSDPDAKPYSPKMTCGKCHPYGEIAKGWHFNHVGEATERRSDGATEGDAGSGPTDRPGEPWIYADARLGIQIPLSLRGWPGTFFPAQIGLSAWQFALHFGRHLCGGGFAEGVQATESGATDQAASPATAGAEPDRYFAAASDVEKKRWAISGGLEIDCMMCHATMASGYDAGEVERQVERQNLRWSATAALGLGLIRGDARSVSNEYDPENPAPPDRADLQLPKIQYEKSKFDGDNRVLFDISRKPPNERCTFCHTTRHVGQDGAGAGKFVERDVHLLSGLSCADCHRNGIDHAIVRGFETPHMARAIRETWQEIDKGVPQSASIRPNLKLLVDAQEVEENAPLSCEGCHVGPHGGTLGAPKPAHVGIPPLHFEKLTCTACHSGSVPSVDGLHQIQTALGHALGVSTKERREDALPHIFEPILGRSAKYAKAPTIGFDRFGQMLSPARVLWPSYWASSPKSKPLPVELVSKAANRVLPKSRGQSFEQPGVSLTDEQILSVLRALRDAKLGENPTYLRLGEQFSLTNDGKLEKAVDGVSDTPQVWAIAHNVRPAQSAMGAKGCTECHNIQSAIFFGRVIPAGTTLPREQHWRDWEMDGFHGIGRGMATTWNSLLSMRGLGKAFLAVAIAILFALLIGWLGSNRFSGRAETGLSKQQPGTIQRLAIVVTLLGALLQLTTALVPARFENLPLLVHSAANPIFIVGLVAWAILWSRASTGRATPRDWITWLTLCAGLGVMTTMLLAMLPLFSTDAMRDLFAWHKYFGIAVLVGLAAVILLSSLNRPART